MLPRQRLSLLLCGRRRRARLDDRPTSIDRNCRQAVQHMKSVLIAAGHEIRGGKNPCTPYREVRIKADRLIDHLAPRSGSPRWRRSKRRSREFRTGSGRCSAVSNSAFPRTKSSCRRCSIQDGVRFRVARIQQIARSAASAATFKLSSCRRRNRSSRCRSGRVRPMHERTPGRVQRRV